MIDIHCHLLPGIDDGPKNMETSLAMARLAVENGIRYSVVTPHLNPGRHDNFRQSIEAAVGEFRDALRDAKVGLHIGFAAEVRLCPEILQLVDADEVPFLGERNGYRFMLLELPHSHIPPGSDKLVDRLVKLGIRPVIAHPERNRDILRDITKIEPFLDSGCLFQLTASSLTGLFGDGPQLRAREFLEYPQCTALASDAHNLQQRTPDLREGVELASRVVGDVNAKKLVYGRPVELVRSQWITAVPSPSLQPAGAAPTVIGH